nr:hypothetical protein [Tanacetum cinerariifolium]
MPSFNSILRAFASLGNDLAFGWLLEEIHVTWARLEKKQTRLRLYIKSLEEILIQTVETASPSLVTALKRVRDGVMILKKASESSHLKRNPRSFVEAMASGNLRRRRGLFSIYTNSF